MKKVKMKISKNQGFDSFNPSFQNKKKGFLFSKTLIKRKPGIARQRKRRRTFEHTHQDEKKEFELQDWGNF